MRALSHKIQNPNQSKTKHLHYIYKENYTQRYESIKDTQR